MDKFAITRKNFHQKEGLWCGNIDAIIGLPEKYDDVLIINASKYFEKGKRQNTLLPEHIDKIIATYQYRKEDDKTYSCRVSIDEIKKNGGQIGEEKYWRGT